MMKSYFDEVVSSLTSEDTHLLAVLIDNGATARFKGIGSTTLCTKAGYSEATFRRVLTRLKAQRFVDSDTTAKEHAVFVTAHGMAALQRLAGGPTAAGWAYPSPPPVAVWRHDIMTSGLPKQEGG